MLVLNYKNKNLISLILSLFGLMTIISGATALFTDVGHETRGNIVPLVLWFNFISGFFYILVGFIVYQSKPYVQRLSVLMMSLNIGVLVYLFYHIFQGGLYETRTLIAMSFRTIFWIFITLSLFNSSRGKTFLY